MFSRYAPVPTSDYVMLGVSFWRILVIINYFNYNMDVTEALRTLMKVAPRGDRRKGCRIYTYVLVLNQPILQNPRLWYWKYKK